MTAPPAKRARFSENSVSSITVTPSENGGLVLENGTANNNTNGHRFTADATINDVPDRVKFAYWVPNVSGGLVISKIPQRTKYVVLLYNFELLANR